jgi:hypothetical protein
VHGVDGERELPHGLQRDEHDRQEGGAAQAQPDDGDREPAGSHDLERRPLVRLRGEDELPPGRRRGQRGLEERGRAVRQHREPRADRHEQQLHVRRPQRQPADPEPRDREHHPGERRVVPGDEEDHERVRPHDRRVEVDGERRGGDGQHDGRDRGEREQPRRAPAQQRQHGDEQHRVDLEDHRHVRLQRGQEPAEEEHARGAHEDPQPHAREVGPVDGTVAARHERDGHARERREEDGRPPVGDREPR